LTHAGEEEGAFVRVARRGDVVPGVGTIVRAGRYEVAVFDVGGKLYAYENCCPHQGGPVGEGIVDGETVICPWHAWCFNLRDGKLTIGDFAALRRFDVRVEDGAVYVASEPSSAS
jgi:NAD(P)H-dependent nitrite reductase small subunit